MSGTISQLLQRDILIFSSFEGGTTSQSPKLLPADALHDCTGLGCQVCFFAILPVLPSRISRRSLSTRRCNSFSSASRSSKSLNPRLITPASRPTKPVTLAFVLNERISPSAVSYTFLSFRPRDK